MSVSRLSIFKQRNVLIDASGSAILCDFGLSRIKYETTRAMSIIIEGNGMLTHRAPELDIPKLELSIPKFRTTSQSDVYALAMTILELGTLSPPFSARYQSGRDVFQAAKRGERPDPPQHLGWLPELSSEQLCSLLGGLWAQDPNRRPMAIEAFRRLKDIKAGHLSSPATPHPITVDSSLGPSPIAPRTPSDGIRFDSVVHTRQFTLGVRFPMLICTFILRLINRSCFVS